MDIRRTGEQEIAIRNRVFYVLGRKSDEANNVFVMEVSLAENCDES